MDIRMKNIFLEEMLLTSFTMVRIRALQLST
ncbi:hypothetical protein SAMN05216285_3843 [Natrinema salifodinae]|uniref:Uncharacterized protein n=1 Tax=Natrinema salifodinae TaxID=1202768 RepID=A0A1I0QSS5_9EURY|nr:hypothetical protein SAMN05216285_3843 [Natrinema salifodinae]